MLVAQVEEVDDIAGVAGVDQLRHLRELIASGRLQLEITLTELPDPKETPVLVE